MELTFLASIIGLIVFSVIMIIGYKYADGKFKVSEQKKTGYLEWVDKYGNRLKKIIIRVSIIYFAFMIFQIITLI
ncbi:hypothetical protein [Flavobacterium sp.]|uniref:hypothetical protein n=1 Tax=Flavobacterium sp. TaxID=239 RepID=UPI0039E4CC4A